MRRNPSGINFDSGVPLQSKWEFEKLYVPAQENIINDLISWILKGKKPLLLGGQIGIGKSTTIQFAFEKMGKKPDVIFHFDREGENLSVGDFWRIILAGLIQKALDNKADLTSLRLPEDLVNLKPEQWLELMSILRPEKVFFGLYTKRKKIHDKIAENQNYIRDACKIIIDSISKTIKEKLLFFASGIDKFDTEGSEFFDLKTPLSFLMSYKTLLELNVIHLHNSLFSFSNANILFIKSLKDDQIENMLQKRMGAYYATAKQKIKFATEWSGGNPRQALRLLGELQFSIAKTFEEATVSAIQNMFLDYFSYSQKPKSELLQTIENKHELEPTLISLATDPETARSAVYGNWIIINNKLANGNYQAIVNPLVKYSINLSTTTESPEYSLLQQYALQHGTSAKGLDYDTTNYSMDMWKSIIDKEIEKPIPLNIVEIFTLLKSSLLSKDRTDRIIVAYRDNGIVKVARSYLFGKANSYEFQTCKHFNLRMKKDESFIQEIKNCIENDSDIISIDFDDNKFNKSDLTALDKFRDNLLEKQILWWIPEKYLSEYLQYWPQLRQLFKIFILEDELLNSLSAEDISKDINFLEDLAENENSSEYEYVKNLKVVLTYLRKNKKRAQNG